MCRTLSNDVSVCGVEYIAKTKEVKNHRVSFLFFPFEVSCGEHLLSALFLVYLVVKLLIVCVSNVW